MRECQPTIPGRIAATPAQRQCQRLVSSFKARNRPAFIQQISQVLKVQPKIIENLKSPSAGRAVQDRVEIAEDGSRLLWNKSNVPQSSDPGCSLLQADAEHPQRTGQPVGTLDQALRVSSWRLPLSLPKTSVTLPASSASSPYART